MTELIGEGVGCMSFVVYSGNAQLLLGDTWLNNEIRKFMVHVEDVLHCLQLMDVSTDTHRAPDS